MNRLSALFLHPAPDRDGATAQPPPAWLPEAPGNEDPAVWPLEPAAEAPLSAAPGTADTPHAASRPDPAGGPPAPAPRPPDEARLEVGWPDPAGERQFSASPTTDAAPPEVGWPDPAGERQFPASPTTDAAPPEVGWPDPPLVTPPRGELSPTPRVPTPRPIADRAAAVLDKLAPSVRPEQHARAVPSGTTNPPRAPSAVDPVVIPRGPGPSRIPPESEPGRVGEALAAYRSGPAPPAYRSGPAPVAAPAGASGPERRGRKPRPRAGEPAPHLRRSRPEGARRRWADGPLLVVARSPVAVAWPAPGRPGAAVPTSAVPPDTSRLARPQPAHVPPATASVPASSEPRPVAALVPSSGCATATRSPLVGVIGIGTGTAVLAAAIAARLSRRHRTGPILLATWPDRPPGSARPGTGPARRVAGLLAAHDVDARAAGRLVLVRLPEDAGAAAVLARRLATRPEPLVLSLAGPRPDALEELLGLLDLTVVATAGGTPSGLADVAAETLGRTAPDVPVVAASVGGRGRRSPGSAQLWTALDALDARPARRGATP